MVEANGTLEPTLDSVKSNGAVVVTASRWPGLVFLLIIILFLGRLLLGRLPPDCLLHSRLLLSCLLGRLLHDRLSFQLFNPRFKHVNLNIYKLVHLVIKMDIIKNRSMT
jgi:hypothetical protein